MPSATPHSHPDVPPFPAPSTFSILPDIYLLIARLNILQPQQQAPPSSQPQQPPTSASSQSQTQTQTQTQPTPHPPAQPTTPSHPTATHLRTGPPLDLKDLPAQVYPIKQKLVKAREAVSGLPDIERSVEEQDAEIRDLERTAALLKSRLSKLGSIAQGKKNGKEEGDGDVVMQGIEG